MSCYRVIVRHPETYQEHIYKVARVRSAENDEYKTSDVLPVTIQRPIPGCVFGISTLVNILTEKFLYNSTFEQIMEKLWNKDIDMPKATFNEQVHKAIDYMMLRMRSSWENEIAKSSIYMIDETFGTIGCMVPDPNNSDKSVRKYCRKYIWAIRAKMVKLAWFFYEGGSRGIKAIKQYLSNFVGFYTTDGYVVYKSFDSEDDEEVKRRRSACLVHIRRYFVNALIGNKEEAMWFIECISKMFGIEYNCQRMNKTGHERLIERLKKGSTADIMDEIESKLREYRDIGYSGCGHLMKKAIKYALTEWPAMKRVVENGDLELSNNLTEQMIRSLKVNLKNAMNIGSEESAEHNAFMFSIVESCKMNKLKVEHYLTHLLERLQGITDDAKMVKLLPNHAVLDLK